MTGSQALVVYGHWRSSATWRVRIALNIKGCEYEYRVVDLLRPGLGEQHDAAYRSLNPLSQVPLLEVHDGRGPGARIAQSLAIVEYLEEVLNEAAARQARRRARQPRRDAAGRRPDPVDWPTALGQA